MRICILLLMIGVSPTYAQLTKVCYDKNNKPVDEGQAEYCMVGKIIEFQTIPGIGDTMWQFVDTVRAYYTATKRLKSLKIFDANGFETGNFVEYYADGKMKERGASHKGKKIGLITTNYPSGRQNYTLQYFPDSLRVTNHPENFKIQNYFDETGMQLVKSGNGVCNCIFAAGIREIGRVRNGLRDSIWSGYSGDTLIFQESYHEGKFVDGVRYYEGTSFRYTKFSEEPSFTEGYEAMMDFLRKNLKYPVTARRMGIDGTVFITFTVTKSGIAEDHKVVRGISGDCDKEALRVAKLVSKWNPGRQRGKPVEVKTTLPIVFKLN